MASTYNSPSEVYIFACRVGRSQSSLHKIIQEKLSSYAVLYYCYRPAINDSELIFLGTEPIWHCGNMYPAAKYVSTARHLSDGSDLWYLGNVIDDLAMFETDKCPPRRSVNKLK